MAGEYSNILRSLLNIQSNIKYVVRFNQSSRSYGHQADSDRENDHNSLVSIYNKRRMFDVNITAVGGLAGAAIRMAQSLVGASYANLQQFGGYSVGGIQAKLVEQIGDLLRNMRISRATSGTMMEFAQAHTRLKNAWEPIQTGLINLTNKAGAAVANKAAEKIEELKMPLTPDLLRVVSPRLARRLATINRAMDRAKKELAVNERKQADEVMGGEDALKRQQADRARRRLMMPGWQLLLDTARAQLSENMPAFLNAAELARKKLIKDKDEDIRKDLVRSLFDFAWPGMFDQGGIRRRMSPADRIEAARSRSAARRERRKFDRDTRKAERAMQHPGLLGQVPRAIRRPVPNDPRAGMWEDARQMIRRRRHVESRRTTASQQLAVMRMKAADDKKRQENEKRRRIDLQKLALEKTARIGEIQDRLKILGEFEREATLLRRKGRRLGLTADEQRSLNEWMNQIKRVADEIERLRKSLRDDFAMFRENNAMGRNKYGAALAAMIGIIGDSRT